MFDEFLLRSRAGAAVDVEELCAENPEYAAALRSMYRDYQRASAMLGALRDGDAGDSPAGFADLIEQLKRPRAIDDYRFVELIAEGGMAIIEKVWDARLRRPVARKVLPLSASAALSPAEIRRLGRFLDEVHVAGQLQHPSILPLYDVGLDELGRPFFTMPIVRGQDFRALLDKAGSTGGVRDRDQALRVLIHVSDALAYAHGKGVVHRDIKPQNIMVGRFGETFVMDWGLAKVVEVPDPSPKTAGHTGTMLIESLRHGQGDSPESPIVTHDGDVVGTPAYMAPEQAAGRVGRVGKLSDQYAVGAILYELLSGRRPYAGQNGGADSPSSAIDAVQQAPPPAVLDVAPDTPPELAAVCEKAMCREPERRYPDIGELSTDLRAFLDQRVVRAYRTGAFVELRKWIARNPIAALALVGALVTVIASLTVILFTQHNHQRRLQSANRELRQARDEAARRLDSQQRSQYLSDVALAQRTLDAGDDAGQVVEALERCPQDLRAWEWSYLRSRADTSLVSCEHGGRLNGLAVSPNADVFATAGHDHAAILWEASSGRQLRSLSHAHHVVGVTFSPDGSRLATTCFDRTLRIWDVATGELERAVPGLASERSIAVTFLDEARVAVGGDDQVSVWSTSGELLLAIERPVAIARIAGGSDGRTLAIGHADGSVVLFDARNGRLQDQFRCDGPIVMLQFAASGSRLDAFTRLATLQTWELRRSGWTPIEPVRPGWIEGNRRALPGTRPCRSGSLSEDGRWLFYDQGATIVWFDLERMRRSAVWSGHVGGIVQLGFAGGSRVVSVSDDGTARVWSRESSILESLRGPTGVLWSVDVAADSSRFVVGGADGSLWMWRVSEPEPAWRARTTGAICSVKFSPDGERVVSIGDSGALEVWASRNGERIATYPVHAGRSLNAVFAPDGQTLVTGSDGNGQVGIWRVPERFSGQRFTVNSRLRDLVFNGDGTSLVGGDEAGRLLRWRVPGWELESQIQVSQREVTAVAHGAGGQVATADGELLVKLWSAGDDQPRLALTGHRSHILDLEFSGDGRRLFSAGYDGTVRVWDTQLGREVLVLRGDGDALRDVGISPDGQFVVAVGHAGIVNVWTIRGR